MNHSTSLSERSSPVSIAEENEKKKSFVPRTLVNDVRLTWNKLGFAPEPKPRRVANGPLTPKLDPTSTPTLTQPSNPEPSSNASVEVEE